MKQGEKVIEDQILSWLKWRGILGVKIKTTATFDPKLGRYRKIGAWYRVGVSDILGVYKGKAFALEVKSKKGKLSPDQVLFLQDWVANGGVGAVVRSVEDVEYFFKTNWG